MEKPEKELEEEKSKTTTIGPNKSNVKSLELPESVAGGRGAHTAVSVLDPVMAIERTDDKNPEYRIVAHFKLQIKIRAFEKGCVIMAQ